MPIRPENLARYPADWPAISQQIRFERAGGRCECRGECGHPHDGGRCRALHGEPAPGSGKTVVLTTAHLNHTPEDCRPENLKAMCQRCHLAYDRDHHAATRAARRAQAGVAPPPKLPTNRALLPDAWRRGQAAYCTGRLLTRGLTLWRLDPNEVALHVRGQAMAHTRARKNPEAAEQAAAMAEAVAGLQRLNAAGNLDDPDTGATP